MNFPAELKYTAEHEWIKVEGNTALIGITDFAQQELGDIVYVEVDTLEETVEKDEPFGTIEAVKTTSELFMPVSGKILEINPIIDGDADDQPETVNKDPYGNGWIVKIELSDPTQLDELMDAEAYKALVQ